eukprot:scaffold115472_cov54-Phaeocystis_antarctica.AAC.1
MSVTVFVTHSSLTDMKAEVKLSSELSVADVKKKRESHVEQGPYGRRSRSPCWPGGRNRLRARATLCPLEVATVGCIGRPRASVSLGQPRPVGRCVVLRPTPASAAHTGLAFCTGSRAIAAPRRSTST